MKKTYRKCDACKGEYRAEREAQSYCSPHCRRAAAYGRERFQSQTTGPRKRLLKPRGTFIEASDASHLEAAPDPETLSATVVAGSFRKGGFSSTDTVPCRGVFTGPIDILGGQRSGGGLDPQLRENILWCEVAPLTRTGGAS